MPALRSCLLAGLAFAVTACAAVPAHQTQPALVISRSTDAPAPPSTPPPKEMTRAEAVSRAKEIRELWTKAPRYRPAELVVWLASNAPPEAEVRALVEVLAKDASEADGALLETLLELLGEVGSTKAGATDTVRTLLRASSRGSWRANLAIERLLERRLATASVACEPPKGEEIQRARDELTSFVVVDRASVKRDKAVLVARAPTASELDDLAYLYAALADSGGQVGTTTEDETTPASQSSDLTSIRSKLDAAREKGDVEAHLTAGLEYLGALGWPGPIRTQDDGDQRWGGAGFSFLMRELARDAELLGRYELAESFYRRASWGGGACGTSAGSYRDDQIAGVVRSVELGRGCRGAVAERLFAVSLDLRGTHGPAPLHERGFDVPRLYRAALLTRNRSDATALRAALASASADALARLDRLGTEDWATRVRAIPGLADSAGKQAIAPLVELLGVGDATVRRDVLEALGQLTQDRGSDPCDRSSGFGFLAGGSSGHERRVDSIMTACDTRLPKLEIDRLVDTISRLATDADPETRQSLARALGEMATARARPVLRRLALDAYDSGGRVCTSTNGGPTVCQRNRPVRIEAEEALAKIAETERSRAEMAKRR